MVADITIQCVFGDQVLTEVVFDWFSHHSHLLILSLHPIKLKKK